MTKAILSWLVAISLIGLARAQSDIPRSTPGEASAQRLAAGEPQSSAGDYRIGAGDVLTVFVAGVPELSKTIEVSESGTIVLPYVGEVSVLGLAIFELERKLTALFDAAVVKDPQVSVLVKEYRSQFVAITGEVSKPGSYPVRHQMSLLEALLLAGWITPNTGDQVYVQRQNHLLDPRTSDGNANGQKTITIDLKKLIAGIDPPLNIPIYPRDIINVSKKAPERIFYVVGNVNKPGPYRFNEERKTYLSEALAGAGGFAPAARGKKATVLREVKPGERMQIAVNADGVLKGEKKDFLLQENDIIFIPGSSTKNLKGQLLNNAILGILTGITLAR